MAQAFRPPEDPLEDLPEPQPDLQGATNTSLDCGSNVYEKQELLHRPHAFALMHGENGAKIAYGELHWAIDVLIVNFKTTTVTVDDHCDHSHAPHDDHSHSDHTDHSHADHTDHPSHTHTAGVASHDHDHDHTHELVHTHTTDLGGATSTGQPDDATTGTDVAAVSGYGSTSSQTTTTSGVQSGSGYGDHTHDIAHGHDVAMSHTHEHDHTHSISQHSHTTTSIDDATTDSISSVTTGNVNSGAGTVTTSGPNATLTHSSHSGVKTTGSYGTPAGDSGILDHSGVKHTDGSQNAPDGVLKHSGVKDTDGTTTAPACVLGHTVNNGTINHAEAMGQTAIPQITQQVPNIDTEDGDPMLSEIPNEYFQLTGFGDVYLAWKVDLELSPEVQKCWVQVGDPNDSPIAGIGVAKTATDRLDDDPEDDTGTEGVYSVKIGTVTEDNRIQQRVSSDVSWRPVVLDRTRN